METLSLKQGVFFICLAMLCISFNDLIIKQLSGAYPLHEMVFARSVIGVGFSLIFVKLEGGWRILKTNRPYLHFCRAFFVFLSNMTFFAGLAILPLSHATALFFIAPILITILSIPILGETVGSRRFIAVFLGFAGVFVMTKPHTWTTSDIAPVIYLLPVVSAFFYSLMQILTRKLSVTSRPSAMAVYIQGTFVLFSLAFGLTAGDGRYETLSDNDSVVFLLRPWIWPTGNDWILFLVLGFLSAGVGYSLSKAYSLASAASIAPFEYILLPMAILWGWTFFGDVPDPFIIMGIILIAGSGLYVFVREQKRQEPNAFERPTDP